MDILEITQILLFKSVFIVINNINQQATKLSSKKKITSSTKTILYQIQFD